MKKTRLALLSSSKTSSRVDKKRLDILYRKGCDIVKEEQITTQCVVNLENNLVQISARYIIEHSYALAILRQGNSKMRCTILFGRNAADLHKM